MYITRNYWKWYLRLLEMVPWILWLFFSDAFCVAICEQALGKPANKFQMNLRIYFFFKCVILTNCVARILETCAHALAKPVRRILDLGKPLSKISAGWLGIYVQVLGKPSRKFPTHAFMPWIQTFRFRDQVLGNLITNSRGLISELEIMRVDTGRICSRISRALC